MIPFVDIHTHFTKTDDEHVVFIKNFTQNEWINAAYTVAERNPNFIGRKGHFASVGLHPWFLTKENAESDFEKLSEWVKIPSVIAIGECGLDKLKGVDLATQTVYFTKQIQLAETVGKPVVIHCVRAYNEVFVLKKTLKPTVPLIIHGFNKNQKVLDELLKNGFFISIGAAILRGGDDFKNSVLTIPLDKLFFETDDKDIAIESVYKAYSELAKMSLSDLKSVIYQSFEKTFSKT